MANPIEDYVRLRAAILKKRFSVGHTRKMNRDAHEIWGTLSSKEKIEAQKRLLERLSVPES